MPISTLSRTEQNLDYNDALKGYTGGLLEDEFMPKCGPPAIIDRTKPLDEQYVGYRDALEMAIASQPADWNPTDPDPLKYRRGADLHTLVSEAMGIDYSELAMYTTRGTPFDIFHKVDAVFVYRNVTVTVDLKLGNGINGNTNADVVMHIRTGSEDELASYANEIAYCFGFSRIREAAVA